uniref:Uncharacterized protein n=1 Tax=Eutreptiella gymnastica TaxID=73025 RepID=A0A7S4LFV2_9EUGL
MLPPRPWCSAHQESDPVSMRSNIEDKVTVLECIIQRTDSNTMRKWAPCCAQLWDSRVVSSMPFAKLSKHPPHTNTHVHLLITRLHYVRQQENPHTAVKAHGHWTSAAHPKTLCRKAADIPEGIA